MFKAIGFVIALYAVSNILGDTFVAFEAATVSTFKTLETAADVSRAQLLETQQP